MFTWESEVFSRRWVEPAKCQDMSSWVPEEEEEEEEGRWAL